VTLSEGEHPWKVRLSDLDTGNTLFETEIKAGFVNSSKHYFLRLRIEAWPSSFDLSTAFIHPRPILWLHLWPGKFRKSLPRWVRQIERSS
jgi:hypothetical protein